MIHDTTPPIAPSNVLFGDIFGNILCLPIDLPTKYPPTSEAIIRDKRYKGCFKLIDPGKLQIMFKNRYKASKI